MFVSDDVLRRLCRARMLLRDVPEEPLSIEDLARQLRLSSSHFTRQFDAVFGCTPHQFRIQARIDRARRLLADGHHSVTDVCMDVGFSSLGSFSDLFARRVGVPPSVYQRQARVMVQVPGLPRLPLVPGCFGLMGSLPATAFR